MADNANPKRVDSGKPKGTAVRIWVLLGLTAVFFLIAAFALVFIVTKSFQNREIAGAHPPPSATPEPSLPHSQSDNLATPGPPIPRDSPIPEGSVSSTHADSPTSTQEVPSASPEFTPETPSPSSSPTPSDSAGGETEIPVPSAGNQATPPPVVANAQEEDATRKEVLKRIDIIRELTPKEKDYLYYQVARARGFKQLAIVPYGSRQLWPDSFQTNYLLENLSKPSIAKIFEDPTVVLVMVGYSDLKGSDERNLEISRSRAENLIKLLHRKTKISNLMRAVGMGGSDLFDKMHLEKNRVVEMWIVRP